MSERGGTIQILTGEAMWPDRVNARWPGAQFVARARFDAGGRIGSRRVRSRSILRQPGAC